MLSEQKRFLEIMKKCEAEASQEKEKQTRLAFLALHDLFRKGIISYPIIIDAETERIVDNKLLKETEKALKMWEER